MLRLTRTRYNFVLYKCIFVFARSRSYVWHIVYKNTRIGNLRLCRRKLLPRFDVWSVRASNWKYELRYTHGTFYVLPVAVAVGNDTRTFSTRRLRLRLRHQLKLITLVGNVFRVLRRELLPLWYTRTSMCYAYTYINTWVYRIVIGVIATRVVTACFTTTCVRFDG